MSAPTIRLIHELSELESCSAIEQGTWGVAERDLVPLAQLRASIHAGGMVAGAWLGEELAGFVYGFPAHQPAWPEPFGLHSHMLAVLPAYRGRGLGKALKWFQRDWCLQRGLSWMSWTFDPLQAKNARLNLEHLGARASHYYMDAYGTMGGSLNRALPTDRLLAVWTLQDPHVLALERGEALPPPPAAALTTLLQRSPGNEPVLRHGLDETADRVALETPANVGELMHDDPELALRWRLALRETLCAAFELGFVAQRFITSRYILKKQDM